MFIPYMAAFVLLLNTDAPTFNGWEFEPLAAVATAMPGRLSAPRMVPAPFTSSVVVGVVVLMPILAVAPVPVCETTELMMSLVVSHRGRKFNVPNPVIAALGVADEGVEVVVVVEVEFWPTLTEFASKKAEGGNPPRVSESPAFSA